MHVIPVYLYEFTFIAVILGSNGWDDAFEKPLGQPLGPPTNVTDSTTGRVVALTRKFASGTSVWYNLTCVNSPAKQAGYNCSRIEWGSVEALRAWEAEQS